MRRISWPLWQKSLLVYTPVSQRPNRPNRGRPAVTGRRDGLLKQTAQIPGADCCRSSSERAVGAGRGRTAVTGRRGWTFETNGTDSWRQLR